MTTIYKIQNIVNGKVYIGITTQKVQNRLSAHKSLLKKNKHHNADLQSDWNKYGHENFTFEKIDRCSDSIADKKESEWIEVFNSHNPEHGYNKTYGGMRGNPTEEVVLANSGVNHHSSLRRKLSDEQIIEIYKTRNINQRRLGRKFGVGEGTVSKIQQGKLFSEITQI